MSTVTRTIDADAERVWSVLADGWLYSGWVVGTSHMRAVETAWPAVGSCLHHATGLWPLVFRDRTEVRRSEAGRRLVLLARGWPMGEAVVDLTLTPIGTRTEVQLCEEPVAGPGRWVHNPATERLLDARNREGLARLAALSEAPVRPV